MGNKCLQDYISGGSTRLQKLAFVILTAQPITTPLLFTQAIFSYNRGSYNNKAWFLKPYSRAWLTTLRCCKKPTNCKQLCNCTIKKSCEHCFSTNASSFFVLFPINLSDYNTLHYIRVYGKNANPKDTVSSQGK